MFQIVVFIPESHKEHVKDAMFQAGAGRLGNYDRCSFEVSGLGQFRPLKGAQPFVGSILEVENVKEVRVEMICEDHLLKDVIHAMKNAHPYETPAYYATGIVGI